MNESYANECIVECTDNGKTVEAEVGSFQPEKYLQVFMNTVKVNLQYQPAHKFQFGILFLPKWRFRISFKNR